MTVWALVVAGGGGERLGAGLAKGFVELAGQPLMVHAARACAAVADQVVVVVPAELEDDARELLPGRTVICAGGVTRQESVRRGLARCSGGVVAVHDAARALVSPGLIRSTVDALTGSWSAVAPALAVADTIKRVAGEAVSDTVERADLRLVQTPQAFRTDEIAELHERYADSEHSDDLALVERAGGRVRLIAGDPRNFKITFPADLLLAEAVLRAGREVRA